MNTTALTERTSLEASNLTISKQSGEPLVTGVSLHLRSGETLGIVGESGSGKSMTAKALIGLLPPGVVAGGEVLFGDKDLTALSESELTRLRGSGISMVLQDPFTMLNPSQRCGAQILATIHASGRRIRGAEARAEVLKRLAEVGLGDERVIDAYPFELSGGMLQRVAIAAAIACDPEVLIADEPSTALDVTTQKEVLDKLKGLQESRGMSLILITHDLRVAFSVCDRILVLYAGQVVEHASTAKLRTPSHPYTVGLLSSEPSIDVKRSAGSILQGSVPAAADVVDRCAFADRCPWVTDLCKSGRPALVQVGDEQRSACIRYPEIAGELDNVRKSTEPASAVPAVKRDGLPLKPIVTVRDLIKTFPGRRRGERVRALGGVSFEVGEDECVGLVGESGSGKSTVGRSIVGLEQPDSGTIYLGNETSSVGERSTDAPPLYRMVQMVFQDPYSTLNPSWSIRSTLAEAVRFSGVERNSVQRRVNELLELVQLPKTYASRKPSALSGGERQRIAIARSLALQPRVIVCDEPVSALDVSVQAQILELLSQIRRDTGVSLLFITHDLAVVRQVADRVLVLYHGELVESGSVDDVLDNPQHPYTRRLIASVPSGRS